MWKFDEKKWIEEVKCCITRDRKADEKPPCIFSAPTALAKEYTDAYVPQIVSIGPCHFGKQWLRGIETFKGDAARREIVRIQRATGNSEFNFEQVIEKIRSREEEIKRCYDMGTVFKGEVLRWMVARDARFILEFFRNHLCGLEDDDEDGGAGCLFHPKLHPIFGPETMNPVVTSEVMKDLIKIDNQIPLFVLEDVLAMEMPDSPDNAKAKLDKLLRAVFEKIYYRPFEFCAKGKSPRQSHILDIYHYFCLGAVAPQNEKENEDEMKLKVYCSSFAGSDDGQCSCFGRAKELQRSNSPLSAVGGTSENVKGSIQLDEWGLKVPTAVQLKNGGVKFQVNAEKVDDIKYEGKTLTLVPLKLDVDSEVYIRNLIALEICSPDYKHKRMTAYAKFMYELCQTDKGVDAMRKKGVIIGNLWHSKRVIRLLSVSNFTISQPECKSIKQTRKKLSLYYKTERSSGGFEATTVIFLTAIQVVCFFCVLFYIVLPVVFFRVIHNKLYSIVKALRW